MGHLTSIAFPTLWNLSKNLGLLLMLDLLIIFLGLHKASKELIKKLGNFNTSMICKIIMDNNYYELKGYCLPMVGIFDLI